MVAAENAEVQRLVLDHRAATVGLLILVLDDAAGPRLAIIGGEVVVRHTGDLPVVLQ